MLQGGGAIKETCQTKTFFIFLKLLLYILSRKLTVLYKCLLFKCYSFAQAFLPPSLSIEGRVLERCGAFNQPTCQCRCPPPHLTPRRVLRGQVVFSFDIAVLYTNQSYTLCRPLTLLVIRKVWAWSAKKILNFISKLKERLKIFKCIARCVLKLGLS